RHLLLAVKNNLGTLSGGLGYHLTERIIASGIVALDIIWDQAPVTITANEALTAASSQSPTEKAEATDFLREILADGPIVVSDILKQAAEAGIEKKKGREARQGTALGKGIS